MHKLACPLLLAAPFLAAATAISAGPDDFKPELGFVLLFNGKNLDGWKTKKGESLDGKTEAYNGRFKVTGANLVIDPKIKGDLTIVTAKELKDGHIKFEFLPGPGCNNDLYFRGLKFDLKKGDVKNFKEGEWHEFEIVAQDGKVEFKCNGEVQRTVKAKTAGSPLGVRAEYGAVQIRRIRAKAIP